MLAEGVPFLQRTTLLMQQVYEIKCELVDISTLLLWFITTRLSLVPKMSDILEKLLNAKGYLPHNKAQYAFEECKQI